MKLKGKGPLMVRWVVYIEVAPRRYEYVIVNRQPRLDGIPVTPDFLSWRMCAERYAHCFQTESEAQAVAASEDGAKIKRVAWHERPE